MPKLSGGVPVSSGSVCGLLARISMYIGFSV